MAAFAGFAIATYFLAQWIRPSRPPGGHPTMALGHALLALSAGAIAALLSMYADRRAQRRRRERELRAIEGGAARPKLN